MKTKFDQIVDNILTEAETQSPNVQRLLKILAKQMLILNSDRFKENPQHTVNLIKNTKRYYQEYPEISRIIKSLKDVTGLGGDEIFNKVQPYILQREEPEE